MKTSNRQSRHIYVSARAALRRKMPKPVFLSPRNNVHYVLLSIARDAAWILEQPVPAGDLNAFRIRYRQLLAEKEYATYSGRIRMDDLFAAFKAHYSDTVLERLQRPLPNEQMETWLHRLLRHPKSAHHPVRHFLVMRFLGHAAQAFFSLEAVEPFGSGPWLCLNQASDHYKTAMIEHLETHYTKDRGKPVGTFRCPQCGFTYQRTGPDENEGDRYRIDRMVDFGSQWLRSLRALQTTDISLREKARRLGVTARTVQRYEEMLRAETPQKQVLDEDKHRDEQREKRKRQREAWRRLQETHSTLSVTQLRALAPGLYMWLYRNDRTWFEMFNQGQPKLQLTPSPRRVDWAERDRTFAASVISAAERLRRVGDERPQRTSAAALAREFGRVSVVQQHLDKLPLTARALNTHVETREAFALRRIAWAVRQCRKRRQIPKYWQLARLAGLRPDMLAQPEVDAAVKHAVVELAYLSMKVTVEDG